MLRIQRLVFLFITLGIIIIILCTDFIQDRVKTIALNCFSIAFGLQLSLIFVKYEAPNDH